MIRIGIQIWRLEGIGLEGGPQAGGDSRCLERDRYAENNAGYAENNAVDVSYG